MKLSIIIPVYNAQKYIKICLESVKASTVENMECILINDGSTDHSEEICEQFVKADKRFRLISKKNQGVSAARNTGILAASGEQIMFLDADDYFTTGFWEVLPKYLEQRMFDFIAFSYITLFDNGKTKQEIFQVDSVNKKIFDATWEKLLTSSQLNTCWAKLFSLDILKNEKIFFPEDLKIGEDFIFVTEYLKFCKNPLLSEEPILFYRQHNGSAMRNYNVEERLDVLEKLYFYSKKTADDLKFLDLKDKMKVYYFKMVTNLFLEFAKTISFRNMVNVITYGLKRSPVTVIVEDLNGKEFASKLKKMEYRIIKTKQIILIVFYFKLKALIAKIHK